jgi:MoaA/NifB/PqqE/SkfB family radical SAM enzyme
MIRSLSVDPRFAEHFAELKQVFLYLVDRCNLRCAHCLYKPLLDDRQGGAQIELEQALALLRTFRDLGACKLTIMGGEPTLYGGNDGHKSLFVLIDQAKQYGYDYLRMDSNGLFPSEMLEADGFRTLDEITFSLDGPSPEVNDPLRGAGTFDCCLASVRRAVACGYKVDVTCCVHRGFVTAACDPSALLDRFILLMQEVGVHRVNFHPVFKMGIPRDTWSGETNISPRLWVRLQSTLADSITGGKYRIPVRVPKRFVTRPEFQESPDYYGYCSAKLGERVLVHPDGTIRVCALLIGTALGIAKYDSERISWIDGPTNELRRQLLHDSTPCSNQCRGENGLLPLCISFKPKQDEFIWNEKLEWESRRKAAFGTGARCSG